LVFVGHSRKMQGYYLQLGRDHFLAYFSYFEKIEQAYEITLLSVCVSVYPPYRC
jgi:hypothetical protein